MTEQDIMKLNWWEVDELLSPKDRVAIDFARGQDWTEIRVEEAETAAGRYKLKSLISSKRHRDEYTSGML